MTVARPRRIHTGFLEPHPILLLPLSLEDWNRESQGFSFLGGIRAVGSFAPAEERKTSSKW